MKNHYFLPLGVLLCLFWVAVPLNAQEKLAGQEDHSYRPLTLKLDESGSKYIRFLMWHQIWASSTNFADDATDFDLDLSIRRSRFLAFAQVSPRFLILTHFGLNGLNADNLTSLGNNGDSPQLFLHGAWGEFKIHDYLYMGAGLHYWKGMNRLANSSTLNFMTLDHTRPFIGWHSLGYTDQFARHIGIYAKGQIGKFDYRLAVNEPLANNLEAESEPQTDALTYNAAKLAPEETGKVLEGYFRYNFWDTESTKLPYAVGAYLGKKRVLQVGAGFFLHPDGTLQLDSDDTSFDLHNVTHFSVDAFLDRPLGQNHAITAYFTYMNFNYGPDWVGLWAGTGSAVYGHLGYYFGKLKLQPYIAFQHRNYDGMEDNKGHSLDAGLNYFINGHNAKLTLEYHLIENTPLSGSDLRQLRLQAHFFL